MGWEDYVANPYGALAKDVSKLVGGGGSEGGVVTEQIPTLSPKQQALLDQLTARTSAGLKGPVPSYPGSTTLGMTPEEQAYFQKYGSGYAIDPTAATQAYTQYFDPATYKAEMTPETQAYLESFSPEAAEKFWQTAMAPQYEEAEKRMLEQTKETYAGPGYWGTARAGAEMKGMEDIERSRLGAYGSLMYGEKTAERTAMGQVAEIAETLEKETRDKIESAMKTGMSFAEALSKETRDMTYKTDAQESAIARYIGEQSLMENFRRWTSGEEVEGEYNPAASPYFQDALALLGIDTKYVVGGVQQPQPSGWDYLLQGIGSGAGQAIGSQVGGG